MKFISLSLAFLVASSTVFATENSEKNSRSASPSKTMAKGKVIKTWRPTAFSENSERLSRNYKGLNPKLFYEMFQSKISGLKKGEFETSEAFTQRIANKDAVLFPITMTDHYAFGIDNISFTYDADAQAFTIGGYYYCKKTFDENWITCKVASVSREHDSYLGMNAFGASRTIERSQGRDFALAIPNGSPILSTVFSQDSYVYKYQDKLSMPLEKAKILKYSKISVLFVGRVSDAKIIKGRSTLIEPKIDKPIDIFIEEDAVPFDLHKIIYYVTETGEILDQKSF